VELRKVQLTGGSSITVTLPKPWIAKAKIGPGDVVGCVEQPDGSLAIHPHIQNGRKVEAYEFEAPEGHSDYLFRKLIAAYLMGYDLIKITSKRPLTADARSTIRQAVRRLMGLEIVEEQPSSITIQDFLDPRELHLEKALRRMAVLAQAMQEEAAQLVHKPPVTSAPTVDDRDDEVDRLFWLVNKQYHAILRDTSYAAKVELNASQALNFLLAARLIERTADHADRIADQARQLGRAKVPETFLDRLEKQARRANELFQSAINALVRRDSLKANDIINEANKFVPTQERILKDALELGSETVSHLVLIIESIGRTAAYAADMGELAVNHKVASES
jgi:phosphate uptake regulator